MANFGNCIEWVLRLEDRRLEGKSLNLGDGAGWTRFGITSKNNPQLPETFFSDSSTSARMKNDEALEVAKDCYWRGYWQPIRGSELPTDELAATMLSFNVNDMHFANGALEAVKLLQEALGLNQDGFLGPITMAAVQSSDPSNVSQKLREAQERYYLRVLAAKPNDERFRKGWIARARVIYPDLP
jgi:lysozyme family protein